MDLDIPEIYADELNDLYSSISKEDNWGNNWNNYKSWHKDWNVWKRGKDRDKDYGFNWPRRGRSSDLWLNSKDYWQESYSYDKANNLTTRKDGWGSIDYSYNAANQITQMGERSYTHDANGNLIHEEMGKESMDYSYNPMNRLIKTISTKASDKSRSKLGHSKIESTTVQHAYDALSRKVFTQEEGSMPKHNKTSYFMYEGLGFNTALEVVDKGHKYRPDYEALDYVYGATGLISIGEMSSSRYRSHGKNDRTYFFQDPLGSTVLAADEKGHVKDRFEYDVFGSVYNGDLEKAHNIGYNGTRINQSTGLYNYGFRHYSSATKNWVTSDPIKDGLNWYAYVGNDPVNLIDLLGLLPGDLFSTVDEAAHDFALTYNDDSIRNNKEYGTTIYYTRYNSPKTKFYYSQPNQGNSKKVNPQTPPITPGDVRAAYAHTHGDNEYGWLPENFSGTIGSKDDGGDIGYSERMNTPIYLVTPGGQEKKYDPITDTVTDLPIDNNIPSSPASGSDRKTTTDPNSGVDNNYTDKAGNNVTLNKTKTNNCLY